MSPRIIQLDSDEGKRVVGELRAEELTVLVGSGISSFEPTSLPTGMALGKAIAQRLAAGGASDQDLLVRILSDTAFEHIMERCPGPERVREVLSRRFRDVVPNPVHEALARLAAAGVVRHLITPNYDVALERAFAQAAPSSDLVLVRREEDRTKLERDSSHALFKIHGCATEAYADTIVFRLTDEAQLEPWKRDTLHALVAGRPLLVVAYSGLDFEICPELPRMRASRLVWLHFGDLEWMTANAWRVVRQSGGVVLQGDAQALLGALQGDKINADWAPAAAADFVAELFSGFSDEELDAWRTRLFGEIGCARDAITTAERLVAAAESRRDIPALGRALTHRGRGRFHQGRYIDAATDYTRATQIFRRSGDALELREALNGIVECNRCAGRYERTLLALRELGKLGRAAKADREQQSAHVDRRMLGSLLRRHGYQLATLIPRRRGLRRLRKRLRVVLRERASRDIAEVAEFAAQAGNWLQLQQTKMWAKRYGLHWNKVFRGTMDPLPPREGYRQLGYIVAQSMALRDEGKVTDEAEARARLKEVDGLLEALVGVEAWPEAWKLARFAEQHLSPALSTPAVPLDPADATPPAFPASGVTWALSAENRRKIDDGWRTCQYTPWMRWAREKGIL